MVRGASEDGVNMTALAHPPHSSGYMEVGNRGLGLLGVNYIREIGKINTTGINIRGYQQPTHLGL